MRKIFCVFLFSLLLGVNSLNAQQIRAFEFEVGGLLLFPNGTHVQYSKKGPGWGIYLEPRINIGNTGFDIAAQFSYASIRRSNPKNDLYGHSMHSHTNMYPLIDFVITPGEIFMPIS